MKRYGRFWQNMSQACVAFGSGIPGVVRRVVPAGPPTHRDGVAFAVSGLCAGNKRLWRWSQLPARRGWLLEAERILHDPALGEQTVGHHTLFVP